MSYYSIYTLEKLNPSWPNRKMSTQIKIRPKISQIRLKIWIIILKNNAKLSHTMIKKK
jgi:hypothetical protein